MKKVKIVIAGWNGQLVEGPFVEEGQAEQWRDELNQLLTDPMDKAHIVEIGGTRRSPKEAAEKLNEYSPSVVQTAPEIADELGIGVRDPFTVPDGVDDTESGEG